MPMLASSPKAEMPELFQRFEPLMPSFQTTRRVAHPASNMFALVADMERYPEFVPLCKGIHILKRNQDGPHETVLATMTVAYKLFVESFTSRVVLMPDERTIMVSYLDGPFRRLENRWTFTPEGGSASTVGFYLDYEFKTRAFQLLMGAVFDKAFRKFAEAFEARADLIYGRRGDMLATTAPAIPGSSVL
jgi:coenzyme Q-binding protein COQ10